MAHLALWKGETIKWKTQGMGILAPQEGMQIAKSLSCWNEPRSLVEIWRRHSHMQILHHTSTMWNPIFFRRAVASQPFWPTACNFCLLLAGGGSPAMQRHPRGTPVVGCHGHWMRRPWLRTAMNCEVKRLESYDTCRDKPSQWDSLILGTKQHKFLTIHLPSR